MPRTVRTQLLHDDLDEDNAAVDASAKDSADTAAAGRLRRRQCCSANTADSQVPRTVRTQQLFDDLDEDSAAVGASAKDSANTAAVRRLRRRQCCSRCKCQGQCGHNCCTTT